MTKPSAAVILDTRRPKKDNKYPIKLRVTHSRSSKYYPTKYDLSKEDYKALFEEKPNRKLKEIRNQLFTLEASAKAIIEKLPNFTLKAFENRLFKFNSSESDLIEAYSTYIGVLKLSGRISTAVSYECSIRSLKSFKSTLRFRDITPEFLNDYEKWMLRKGNSITSVGIYLRALRSVFNEAIADSTVNKELYPFGKRKYQIPTGKNTKKALNLSDIKKIFEYIPTPGSGEEKARDFWLLSYLCNGINMKDIARLRNSNVEGDFLTSVRAKTERASRSNPKPISIYLHNEAKKIINKWKVKKVEYDSYLFPILEAGCTPERELQLVQQFIKTVNKWMKKIADKLEIEKGITTYTARHSYATVLKRSGGSIEFISEALGHANIRTTESYLDSFENEAKKYHSDLLTAFGPD